MFTRADTNHYTQVQPGVRLKTLTYGKRTLFTEFRLTKGKVLPKHSHPHEQTGYLVSGAIRLTIGAETFDVKPGDCWCIEGNVEHGAEILADSVAIEVFSPARSDYLPMYVKE